MNVKKLIASICGICAAMFAFAGCATTSTDSASSGSSMWTSLLLLVAIFAIFYFLMILPEKKRKKKAQDMRDSVEVGDSIVTIGGMMGKVVHVSNDKLTFETGEDRVRIEVAKWAISTNEGRGAKKETKDSEETLDTTSKQA